MEQCMRNMNDLRGCRKRNILLQNDFDSAKHEHKSDIEAIHKDCMEKTTSLQKDHMEHLLNQEQKCNNISIIENMSETIADFSRLLNNSKEANQQLIKDNYALNSSYEKCKEDFHHEVKELKELQKDMKKEHAKVTFHTQKELSRYVRKGHELVKNYTHVKTLHDLCEIDKNKAEHSINILDRQMTRHRQNITTMNETIDVYRKLVKAYQDKDLFCIESLNICRNNKPKQEEKFDRLQKLHSITIQNHTTCLTNKNKLLENVTHCQNDILSKNDFIYNLTQAHDKHKADLDKCSLLHNSCSKSNSKLEKEKSNLIQANIDLTESNKKLVMDVESFREILKSTNDEMRAVRLNLDNLRDVNTKQEKTIESLLKDQKDKLGLHKQRKALCLETYKAKDKALKELNEMKSAYWTNKKELTACVNSKPYATPLIASNITKNSTLIDYHRRMMYFQSNKIIECMRNLSTNPSNFENHLHYTLADLEKLILLTKNTIPIDSTIFTTSNDLKTCNFALNKCNADLSDARIGILHYIKDEDNLGMNLHKFDFGEDIDSHDNYYSTPAPIDQTTTTTPPKLPETTATAAVESTAATTKTT